MSAFYDSYDYTSYWNGREYEHQSEVIALSEFLTKIKSIDRAIEVGGGYGRLVPYYIYRTKKTILSDPSLGLLSIAKKRLSKFKNLEFLQSTLENVNDRVKPKSFDLVLMIRVMHHLKDPGLAFSAFEKLLTPGGYAIFEFANKIHFKNVVQHAMKGDFGFVNNRETIDIRSKKSKKNKTIAFLNYHPGVIKDELLKHNFEVLEMRSVSNIRSPFLKKYLPKTLLLEIERALQKPLSYVYFGPSIFVLARKKG